MLKLITVFLFYSLTIGLTTFLILYAKQILSSKALRNKPMILPLSLWSTRVFVWFSYLQANTEDELPEYLLGTCRLNHLDATKSIPVKVWLTLNLMVYLLGLRKNIISSYHCIYCFAAKNVAFFYSVKMSIYLPNASYIWCGRYQVIEKKNELFCTDNTG